MGIHRRIVAWAYLLWGSFVLFIGLGALLLYGGIGVAMVWDGEPGGVAFGGVAVALGGALLALAVPNVIAGAGLLLRRRWAVPMGIGLAILHLVVAPIGTLFGGYALFALVADA